MRVIHITVLFLCVAVLSGCKNTGGLKVAEPEIKDHPELVYSSPANYLLTLDTARGYSRLEISSYKDMLELFEELNYTPEAWQAGIREVPRVYLPSIGEKWGTTTTKEITVENKKRLFFRGMAPLVLRANELITKDRSRLNEIIPSFRKSRSVSQQDEVWIGKLAALYKVKIDDQGITDPVLQQLWKKVDIVPASLAMAQGAEESGWGTSRFAAEGNAIYGQWTWGENAIVPEQQRKELGNYGIAAFGSLQESVCAYMLNLNTHQAYAEMREKRAELRKRGDKISGSVLAEQLSNYSERGEDYVKTLKSLMEFNRLEPADDAYLSDMPAIFLVPAVER